MKRTFEFNPSPLELAREFATWNSEDQAHFFEFVRREFTNWENGSYGKDMQVLGIGKALRAHWPDAAQMVRELAADTEESPNAGNTPNEDQ